LLEQVERQPSPLAILYDALQLNNLSSEAEVRCARANVAIEKFFQGDTLLFDMFFAHDGGVKTACGDGPTEKAKKMCVSVMKVLLTSIKFRCAMRHLSVYSLDASKWFHEIFKHGSTIGDVKVSKTDVSVIVHRGCENLNGVDAVCICSIERLKTSRPIRKVLHIKTLFTNVDKHNVPQIPFLCCIDSMNGSFHHYMITGVEKQLKGPFADEFMRNEW
jgi:hypothetical protein